MDDIEALRKQVAELEAGNAKLQKQWEMLHSSLREAWTSLSILNAREGMAWSEKIANHHLDILDS